MLYLFMNRLIFKSGLGRVDIYVYLYHYLTRKMPKSESLRKM
jgi:hypothetical protein